MVTNPSVEVYLLDTAGIILTHQAPAGKVKFKQVSLRPIQQFIQAKGELFIRGDYPAIQRHSKDIFGGQSAAGAANSCLYKSLQSMVASPKTIGVITINAYTPFTFQPLQSIGFYIFQLLVVGSRAKTISVIVAVLPLFHVLICWQK